MRLSAKVEYASLAVLELAKQWDSENPVCVRSICSSHNIPSQFLVQILLQLKGAGLVTSTRGAAGGYQLIKSPDDVTLGEVMAIVDGQEEEIRSATSSESPASRVLIGAWREVAAVEREMLYSLTFAELTNRVRRQAENMYYI